MANDSLPVTESVTLGPNRLPALIRHVPDGRRKRALLLVHGMSGSAPWLAERLPLDGCPGLLRVYVSLPWLRDPGREAMREIGRDDPVRKVFAAVVGDGVRELAEVAAAVLGRPDVLADAFGLYGFSIGGLVALLGALGDARAQVVAVTGTVPNLGYLREMLTGYDWSRPGLDAVMAPLDAQARAAAFPPRHLLIQHGSADTLAQPRYMAGFMEAVRPFYAELPDRLRYITYEGVRHDLREADTPRGMEELARLRADLAGWFGERLGARPA